MIERDDAGRVRSSGDVPYGVIDIGSNSIRLVIFEALSRAPATLFNERVQCGLGRDIEHTGRLDPAAIEPALDSLARFAAVAAVHQVAPLDVVATAAVREAEDGQRFLELIKSRTGLSARILSGVEEARISALGVASGAPGVSGMMGDLGGASLELVELSEGEPGRVATLPIGPLRLDPDNTKPSVLVTTIEQQLEAIPWLLSQAGGSLHLVGGTWRALAHLHIAMRAYPLPIIHGYSLARGEAESFTKLVSGLSPKTMKKVPSVSRRRQAFVPFGALVLSRVIARARPKELMFSAYGLREGLLYQRLDPIERARSPLEAGAHALAGRVGRSERYRAVLQEWLSGLIGPYDEDARIRRVIAELGDISWRDHPDFRAEHAFQQIVRAPFVGLDHGERLFLALTVSKRYSAPADNSFRKLAEGLLPAQRQRKAEAFGLALRLADLISDGGCPERLGRSRLVRNDPESLTLIIDDRSESSRVPRFERLMAEIAQALDLKNWTVSGGASDSAA
jgi:exopolyphosphatase/guanosine-5'-triphosphate,3'-diphosphate pyrophosphatase